MDIIIVNAMSGYLETLYTMNQKLIKLCGANIMEYPERETKIILDIIQDIPRLIPFSYNNSKKILELADKDGLLEFKGKIDYLFVEYENILKENYIFLDKVRKIRNKYEHKMHGIKNFAFGSGTFSLFEFVFEINEEEIKVEAKEFIKLLKQLNILFFKIVKEIIMYANENGQQDSLYYIRITQYNFEDFNELYNSELIRKIGTVMNDI